MNVKRLLAIGATAATMAATVQATIIWSNEPEPDVCSLNQSDPDVARFIDECGGDPGPEPSACVIEKVYPNGIPTECENNR